MTRTTVKAVEAILGGNHDGRTDLDPFIATATVLADRIDAKDGGILSTAALERIEAYLAAHFYCHADQLKQSETRGRASAVYQGQTGMGLRSTQYGQAAIDLDYSGTLASLGKKAASLSWLGLPPSEQTDYEDRD